MQINNNSLFDRIYVVHSNGVYDSTWIGRKNARQRKQTLKQAGSKKVTISYIPISYGSITRDSKS